MDKTQLAKIEQVENNINKFKNLLAHDIKEVLTKLSSTLGVQVYTIAGKMTSWRLGTALGDFYVPYPDDECEPTPTQKAKRRSNLDLLEVAADD